LEEGDVALGAEGALSFLRSLANSGKTIELTTTGSSMAPLIRSGSTVEIHFVPPSELRVGDVVLFRRERRLLLHRLVGQEARDGHLFFLEKGDHQPSSSWIPGDACLGRVTSIETDGRRWLVDSASGRRLSRLILNLSRGELALYRLKTRCLGTRKAPFGRPYIAVAGRLRALLARALAGRRGPAGPA